jgi:hypothetical protein
MVKIAIAIVQIATTTVAIPKKTSIIKSHKLTNQEYYKQP